jgi:hypothetical protein
MTRLLKAPENWKKYAKNAKKFPKFGSVEWRRMMKKDFPDMILVRQRKKRRKLKKVI